MKNKIKSFIGISILISSHAMSQPWCNHGTISEVANVVWSGATTTAMAGGIAVPPIAIDPARYQVKQAVTDYCETYAGGGGPRWAKFMVPGAGSVDWDIYAPSSFNTYGTTYNLNMGVSFKCEKCYAVPPYSQIHNFERFSPLAGTEGKAEYETQVEEDR